MEMKTYPMIIEDGHMYVKVTLRDVVEKCDVSDLPILSEVKRQYDENAKLRELCMDLYVLCYQHEVGWKLADSTWEKYEPCGLCKERHGGASPCASTSRDMSEECCDPYQAELFAKCMAELGIEVPS